MQVQSKVDSTWEWLTRSTGILDRVKVSFVEHVVRFLGGDEALDKIICWFSFWCTNIAKNGRVDATVETIITDGRVRVDPVVPDRLIGFKLERVEE
jgi:hypothetical protein